MIPQSIEYTDAGCALLFAHIDRKTGGPNGRPVGGFRAVGDAIGMEKRTVGIHAKHLAEHGYIHLEMGDGPANKSARMWIKCNPARTKCDHAHALPKGPRARGKSAYSGTGDESVSESVVQKMHPPWPEKRTEVDAENAPVRGAKNAPQPRYARMEGMERSDDGVREAEVGERWIGHCDNCSSDGVLVGYDISSGFHACEPCMGRPF